MATALPITIKKADGTTSIVYALLAGSGGDKSPALWRSSTAPGTSGQQPFFQLSSRNNGDGTVRRLDMTYVYPSVYTDTQGNTQVRSKAVFTGSFALPMNATSADMSEMGAQIANLIKDPLVVGALQTGWAPT